jgi:hypothetical protein
MTNDPIHTERRANLKTLAGLAAISLPGLGRAAAGGAEAAKTGKAGDFDFLNGEWKIEHRRLKDGRWETFHGEATVRTILAGTVSVEELRIASQNFSGMGLRVLDAGQKLWADYWLNGRDGKLNAPTWGSFAHGAGTWDALENEAGSPVIVRGVWDQITQSSCRWHQAVSRDAGLSWEENWIMHWQRA